MLRAFSLGNAMLDEAEPFQKFLAGTAYATRSTYLAAQGHTPGTLHDCHRSETPWAFGDLH